MKKKNLNTSKNNNTKAATILISLIAAFWIFVGGIFFGHNFMQEQEVIPSEDNDINWISETDDPTQENNNNQEDEDETTEELQLYIWEEVNKKWKLNPMDTIWGYTHTLELNNWNKIWLKSRTVVLDEYTWEVEIQWEVEEITQDLHIVEVNNIEWEKSETEEETNEYFFSDYWLHIDYANLTWYSAKKTGNQIMLGEVIDNEDNNDEENINEIISISPFVCDPTSGSRDCEMMSQRFSNFENFTSANWITYYDIAETPQWIFFNDDMRWYYVSTPSEEELIHYSQYINVFNEEKIRTEVENNIENICFKEDENMTIVEDFSLGLEDNLTANIEWISSEDNKISCSIEITIGESILTEINEIEVEETSEVEHQEEETWQQEYDTWETATTTLNLNLRENPWTENPVITNIPQWTELQTMDSDTSLEDTWYQVTFENDTGWVSEIWLDFEDQQQDQDNGQEQNNEEDDYDIEIDQGNMQEFETARGFSLYFSDLMIYSSEFLEETKNLWFDNTNCDYKVNITHWEDEEDTLTNNPMIEVFHCEIEKDTEEISGPNILYMQWEESWEEFLIRYEDEARNIAENIKAE